MLSLITALLFLFPMLSLGQQLHPKPLSKAKEPGVENRKTDPQAKKAADNQPKESPEVICNDSVIEQQTGATKVTEDQETSSNGLYQRYLWATIISAGVAVISLCLVFVQIRISRRVADAAVASAAASQESARIAKESADAIRDSESATVLMVNMGKLEFNPYGGSSSTGRVDVQCSHTFNNCGRTQGTAWPFITSCNWEKAGMRRPIWVPMMSNAPPRHHLSSHQVCDGKCNPQLSREEPLASRSGTLFTWRESTSGFVE
ncbi:MAG TPA: hypothetical protein VFQ43_16325 [Nitrososphaera sp.]|nr:hypothetical protein [Nitrososphaera sp.]